jgi:aspartyl protease family protein
MRNYAVMAILALVAAVIVPRLADRASGGPTDRPASGIMSAQRGAAAPQSSDGRTFTVRQDNRGHYKVEGRVDGRRMDFMVDTGATIIAIPEREAARLGIHPARREYTAQIRTANGIIRAAPTQLARVEVGGLVVRDVAAVVLPDGALSENLLGMSFLSRLRRFEIANGRLMMEQ